MTIGLFSCASPKQQDFVGVWIGDNLTIELKSDGSCIATGDNAYLLLEEDAKNDTVNYKFTGNWEFGRQFKYTPKKWYECNVIHIDLTDVNTRRAIGNIMHYQKSVMNKSCILYFYIGDPDDMNRFKFKRQND